jgi:hypothetical protein
MGEPGFAETAHPTLRLTAFNRCDQRPRMTIRGF